MLNTILLSDNKKILFDKINKYNYSYKSCKNIINRYIDIYINFNYHRLYSIDLEKLFEELMVIMEPKYIIIDKNSFNRMILLSIINNLDPQLSNTNIYKKSFFLLNNKIKYDNFR